MSISSFTDDVADYDNLMSYNVLAVHDNRRDDVRHGRDGVHDEYDVLSDASFSTDMLHDATKEIDNWRFVYSLEVKFTPLFPSGRKKRTHMIEML